MCLGMQLDLNNSSSVVNWLIDWSVSRKKIWWNDNCWMNDWLIDWWMTGWLNKWLDEGMNDDLGQIFDQVVSELIEN